MTRKDYEAIAAIIAANRYSYPNATLGEMYVVDATIIDELVDYMAADNPRFDREKFVTACYGRN